jgi:tetratricopeptide (TPR) repeat protein
VARLKEIGGLRQPAMSHLETPAAIHYNRSGYERCGQGAVLKTRMPVVRDVAWILTVPQFASMALLVVLSIALFWERIGIFSVSLGLFIYLAYSFGSRRLLLRHHRRGLAFVRQGSYPEAIAAFEASYAFFARRVWLDRMRALTMMMPSRQSVREMALINIAYCYGQSGDKDQTKAYYQRALAEFPNSYMAQTALNFIDTVEKDG